MINCRGLQICLIYSRCQIQLNNIILILIRKIRTSPIHSLMNESVDFSTVPGCDQLVVGPTHARGGTLDLLMTDVPEDRKSVV